MKIDCSFLPVFYEHHQAIKAGRSGSVEPDFTHTENIWMGFFGLGKFETYQFLYNQCKSLEMLEDWMIRLKGDVHIRASAAAFDRWKKGEMGAATGDLGEAAGELCREEVSVFKGAEELTEGPLLSAQQWGDWRERGYLRMSGLVDESLCDAVSRLICTRLGVDLSRPETWYNDHPDWHGLMLQVYQDESIQAIRTLPGLRDLFAELYGTRDIVANTEKVSFNPPETTSWKFRHDQLHWDIDFATPDLLYIQGLVYLNDVPEDRGPLTVVSGFHHRFEEWIRAYPDPPIAQEEMRQTVTRVPVPGKKGDIVCWLQTLPHAASANRSDLPRFVQYVSFSRCRS